MRNPVRCTVKVEGGGRIKVYDDTEITCETHGLKYLYGDLDPIQQLAFREGIDTVEDSKCLMARGEEIA